MIGRTMPAVRVRASSSATRAMDARARRTSNVEIRRALSRSTDRRTQRRRLAVSTEHGRDGTQIHPRHFADSARGHGPRRSLRRHRRVTPTVVSERRARVLRLVLGLVVVREVTMSDQVHGGLGNLGHAGGDREQQRDGDQKPHDLMGFTVQLLRCQANPTNPTENSEMSPSVAEWWALARVALAAGQDREPCEHEQCGRSTRHHRPPSYARKRNAN